MIGFGFLDSGVDDSSISTVRLRYHFILESHSVVVKIHLDPKIHFIYDSFFLREFIKERRKIRVLSFFYTGRRRFNFMNIY